MSELSLSVGPVVFPLALVSGAVWPLLDAHAISEAADPFSVVGGARFKSIRWPLFSHGIWIISSILGYSLSALIESEISAIGSFLIHNEGGVSSRQEAAEKSLELYDRRQVLSQVFEGHWIIFPLAAT